MSRNFLHQGSFDPQRMTGGPEAHVGRHVGQVGWAEASPTCSQTPATAGHGGGYGVEEGGEKGAAGPGTHRGPAGGVGLAGGRPAAANLAAADLGFRRGNGDSGGD
jgi:hypothetical protein